MEVHLLKSSRKFLVVVVAGALSSQGMSQIPDLLTAFDAGGRSLGMGSSIGASGTGPNSAINNPAGLGYASSKELSLTFRNLPESNTTVSRNFVNPDFTTDGQSGGRSLTQVGYSTPLNRGRGVIGLNYSVGGFIGDNRTGTNLNDGATIIKNFNEQLRAKTDFFTLGYGRATSDYRSSFGIGLVFASHSTRNRQAYQLFDNNGTPNNFNDDIFLSNVTLDNAGQMTGLGLVAGLQFNPDGNTSVGISARTPISLNGSSAVEDYYSRIPGRLSAGVAKRLARGGTSQDFLLVGGQVDLFFGGSNGILNRDDAQLAFGAGAEYNYRFRNAYIPIRVGFRTIGKGGDGFQRTSAFTYGLGYNPDRSDLALGLDFGNNSQGGTDMSLSLSFRFKN